MKNMFVWKQQEEQNETRHISLIIYLVDANKSSQFENMLIDMFYGGLLKKNQKIKKGKITLRKI